MKTSFLRRLNVQRNVYRYLTDRLGNRTYDLIVVGGGSAGLACSKQASASGAKVVLIDAVQPTAHGTVWGVGGTCVNVGCVPKKLMHLAAVTGEAIKSCGSYGWRGVENPSLDWSSLVKAVQDKVKATNWIYRVQLREKNVEYVNGFASFINGNSVRVVSAGKKKFEYVLTAKNIVLATGLRPKYPNIPGSHYGITSDDLFSLKRKPGKSLIVGSSYVGLECAGFLNSLCGNTHLMIRSIPLRGFDRQCAEIVLTDMISRGVKVLPYFQPVEVENDGPGNFKVKYSSIDGKIIKYDNFNTVIWAIGREAKLEALKIQNAGIKISQSDKIVVDERDQTTVPGIYALGDIAQGRPELSPPAMKAGQLLALRLFGGSSLTMDYQVIPTTVFTPLEYSSVGLSEETAIERFGTENIEVYHTYYEPYEFIVPHDPSSKNCFIKVITERQPTGLVLGMHFIGPNAAEVMQGFAAAMEAKVTREQLFSTIAIHPCSAEEIIKLSITKRSGLNPTVTGCCG